MLELYQWKPTATSARVLICLHEKNIEYTAKYVDLMSLEQFAEPFLSINPRAQVPVLVVDGRPMYESVVINEYLEEAYPEVPLAPRDPKGWYDQQGWTKFLDYNLCNSVATLGWWLRTRPSLSAEQVGALALKASSIPVPERKDAWLQALADEPVADQLDNSRRKVELTLNRMENALEERQWLLGEEYSLVDIAAFPHVRCLADLTPDLMNADLTPSVCQWVERVSQRPAVKAAMSCFVGPNDGMPPYAPGPEHSRWG